MTFVKLQISLNTKWKLKKSLTRKRRTLYSMALHFSSISHKLQLKKGRKRWTHSTNRKKFCNANVRSAKEKYFYLFSAYFSSIRSLLYFLSINNYLWFVTEIQEISWTWFHRVCRVRNAILTRHLWAKVWHLFFNYFLI